MPEPNNLVEVPMVSSLRRTMFEYYRDRTKAANTVLKDEEETMVVDKTKKAFKESRTGYKEIGDFVSSDSKLGL